MLAGAGFYCSAIAPTARTVQQLAHYSNQTLASSSGARNRAPAWLSFSIRIRKLILSGWREGSMRNYADFQVT